MTQMRAVICPLLPHSGCCKENSTQEGLGRESCPHFEFTVFHGKPHNFFWMVLSEVTDFWKQTTCLNWNFPPVIHSAWSCWLLKEIWMLCYLNTHSNVCGHFPDFKCYKLQFCEITNFNIVFFEGLLYIQGWPWTLSPLNSPTWVLKSQVWVTVSSINSISVI